MMSKISSGEKRRCVDALLAVVVALSFFAGSPVVAQVPSIESGQFGGTVADQRYEDSYLWLEDTGSEAVNAWISEKNSKTLVQLESDPRFAEIYERFLKERTNPQNTPQLFAMRQDRGVLYWVQPGADGKKGALSRMRLENFAEGSEDWEPLVDLDGLSDDDKRDWFVYFSNIRFSPAGTRMLLALTDGGEDAVALREYDLVNKRFVSGGFATPSYRQTAEWLDEDTILIAAAVKEGESTAANYSSVVRRWERGSELSDAEIVFEVDKSHILASVVAFESGEMRQVLLSDLASFSDSKFYAYSSSGDITKLQFPPAPFQAFTGISGVGNHALFSLEHDSWGIGGVNYPLGSVIAIDLARMLEQGGQAADITSLIYTPQSDEALVSVSASLSAGRTLTSDAVYLNVIKDVSAHLKKISLLGNGNWHVEEIDLPPKGAIDLPMYGDRYDPRFVLKFQNTLTPPQLYLAGRTDGLELVAAERPVSDLSDYSTEQYFAVADDGVRIPYFVTQRKDKVLDGETPVLMFGYGAFGLPITPAYRLPFLGALPEFWIEQGGAFVSVNPRGGGEYGPKWHLAAQLHKRQRSFDDIYAIAEDLVGRQLTAQGKIAWVGASNGGLTAGVVATQRPDLFGASIALVPLADMMRYHKLLAGPSWMSEYGNPDNPDDRQVLLEYSPYHNMGPERELASMLYITSTKDDRVHPGHARKMTAKAEALGKEILFYEDPQGGHLLSVTPASAARVSALQAVFLMQQFMDKTNEPDNSAK